MSLVRRGGAGVWVGSGGAVGWAGWDGDGVRWVGGQGVFSGNEMSMLVSPMAMVVSFW